MQKTTVRRIAKFSVYGALGLSMTVGIMPNIAALGGGNLILFISGLVAIFSILVVEAAVVVCGFIALNALEARRFALHAILACILLPVALLWSGYNIKRGLDMAPSALTEQRQSLLERAESQQAQADTLRAEVQASVATGRYINMESVDRSIRAAERTALDARMKAALVSTPHPWMLVVLAAVIKLIELLLMYIATAKTNEPRPRRKTDDEPDVVEASAAPERPTLVVNDTPKSGFVWNGTQYVRTSDLS